MSTPLHTLAQVPSGGSLEDAFADALAGKPFNDVIFYASARDEAGGERRAVHANRRVLMSSSNYFRQFLSSGKEREVSPKPVADTSAMVIGDTRDEDESTLGDDDDIDALESLLAAPSEVSFRDDESEIKLPDSASEDTKSVSTTVTAASSTRIITLDNVAADTLDATIFYIYTGNVYFLPLRSSVPEVVKHDKERPNRPMCSCKAAYRFADEAGLDELKQLAEAHLFAQLDAENILAEVFSPFSSQYHTILRKQVYILLEKYWTLEARAGLGPIVERVVCGELPHAAPALNMLLGEIPVALPATSAEDRAHGVPSPKAQAPASSPSVEFSPDNASPVKAVPAKPSSPERVPKISSTASQPAPSPPAAAAVGASEYPPAASPPSSTISSSGRVEPRSADATADATAATAPAELGSAPAAPKASPALANSAVRTIPPDGGWFGKGMSLLKKAVDSTEEEYPAWRTMQEGAARPASLRGSQWPILPRASAGSELGALDATASALPAPASAPEDSTHGSMLGSRSGSAAVISARGEPGGLQRNADSTLSAGALPAVANKVEFDAEASTTRRSKGDKGHTKKKGHPKRTADTGARTDAAPAPMSPEATAAVRQPGNALAGAEADAGAAAQSKEAGC
ncbi:hypothetical protein PsYK624_164920 [Phanerochaete sordida]|uniref:BTB domain-containing protein n=1 Tax=Phanerochaete sordida TaxID=48140 RepID=A0A9P3LM55_9APHY|nr:hypothetical protein PsYK624_164920 [Phanerochaete sordida]